MEIQRVEGSKRRQLLLGWGDGLSRSFFQGFRVTIGELLKTNSCSVEQAISYFTANRCFKAKIIFSINDRLFVVS